MEGVCYNGRNEGQSMSNAPKLKRTIRRMHSFDRGIKIANQHRNPDLEEELPSYMRQTCASLVKRAPSKTRVRFSTDEQHTPRNASTKDKKSPRKTREHSQGKAGKITPRALSGSDDEISKAIAIRSPWCERSMLAEDQGSVRPLSVEPSNAGDLYEMLLEKNTGAKELIAEENLASVLLEECFEEVIHDTATTGRSSPETPPKRIVTMRGRSISSNTSLEDAYSEVAQDDSFCYVLDSDGEEDTQSVVQVGDLEFTRAFFQSTSIDLPSAPLLTAHSEKITSQSAEDVARDMDMANWLDEDEENTGGEGGLGEAAVKLESHRLEDFCESWTDSELGDDLAAAAALEQDIFTAPTHSMISFIRSSSIDSDFDLHLPLSSDPRNPNKVPASNGRIFSKDNASNKSDDSGSYHIQCPRVLWMLGGNVLAGVIGATLASVGMPPLLADEVVTNAAGSAENDEIVATPRSDVAHADDWFFQGSSLRANHVE